MLRIASSRVARSASRFTFLCFYVTVALALPVVLLVPAETASAGGPYTALPSVPLLAADPVNANPYGIVAHPTEPLVYVALAGEVAFPPALPEDFNGSTVVEIDLGTGEVTRSFATGLFPTELVIASDATELFATNSTSGTLSCIDLGTGSVANVPLTDSLGMPVSFVSGVALSSLEDQIWVASNGSNFDGSDENIIVVDRASRTIVRREVLAGGISRFALLSDGRAVVPVGFPGNDFFAAPQVQIYDTNVTPWGLLASLDLVVDTADFPAPVDIAVSSDEGRAYITVFGGSGEVFVVDLNASTLLPALDLSGVDFVQHGLTLSADDLTLFVSDFFASQVRVVDTTTGLVQATLPVGAEPNELVVHGGRLLVTSQDGVELSALALPGGFIRGDANLSGSIDIADGIQVLNFLFDSGQLGCEIAADFNGDDSIGIDDGIAVFSYLFSFGAAPAYPFPGLGTPIAVGSLECVSL